MSPSVADLPPHSTSDLPVHPVPAKASTGTNGTVASSVTAAQPSADDLMARLSQHPNLSLHVTPDHTLNLSPTEIPSISPTQVLLHVRATGICGSDLHLWHRGAIGPLVVDQPSILGHEAAGVVLAVGSAVTTLRAGDRVAIEPGVPCDRCWLCKAGKYNLCEDVAFAGVCPYPGTLRRFMAHESRFCHRIPADMTFARAALLEPLAVVLHALEQVKINIGRPALVCGAGPIGLVALKCARAQGAWPLVITDVEPSRLAFAQKFVPGVTTYQVQMGKTPEESAREIRALFGESEYEVPSVVLECTGVESSVATAALSCRRAGEVMVIGVGRSIMNNLPFMHLSLAEIRLKFTNRYADSWPAGINAMSSGVMDLDSLITHSFSLENALDAFNVCADPKQSSIKIQIVDDVEL